jgi:condensin complex subunit 1
VVGAEADDTEGEFIRSLCEKRIVSGDNLLAQLAPVISEVCAGKYASAKLRSAASLALAKFMLVSSEFCDDNLQVTPCYAVFS